jgi:hypothetical protein
MQPPLSLRLYGLHFLSPRQRGQQGLRLRNLRHFHRRRKAIERGREDVMRLDWAGGRLVELGERERRAQFEAGRSLLPRDGDGG